MINRSAIYAFHMMALLLQTHSPWRPYQSQLVVKKYLPVHYGPRWTAMKCPQLTQIEMVGPGTLLYLRNLCPEGFAFVDRLHGGDGFKLHHEDTKSSTVEGSSTAGVKQFAKHLLEILVLRQDTMHLHKHVNDLLGITDLDFDAMQNTVCKARSFIDASKPRKSAVGFALDMREAHKAWRVLNALESRKIATLIVF